MKILRIIYNPLRDTDVKLLNVINVPEDNFKKYQLESLQDMGWVSLSRHTPDLVYLNLDHPVNEYSPVAEYLYNVYEEDKLDKFINKLN